jgi:hypothetical protein
MFAFLLMMAGYLVIRFVVMTAPVWATVAIIPQTQGILRSAASVAAAAVVHPVIMAVGASISVLTTGYLLNPDTGLGWLGLLLSVLFTAMMWTVLRPYRRLTSLVTGNPVESPTRTLSKLRDQAGGLARGTTGALTGGATGTTGAATGTGPKAATAVTRRISRSEPTNVPAWARSDDGPSDGADRAGPPTRTAPAAMSGSSGSPASSSFAPLGVGSRSLRSAAAPGPTVRAALPSSAAMDPPREQDDIERRTAALVPGARAQAGQPWDAVDALAEDEQRSEPTMVDGEEVYVIFTPDGGFTTDTDDPRLVSVDGRRS